MGENEVGHEAAIARKNYNIESSVGRLQVSDVSPTNLKTNTPVIIAPGWSGMPDVYDGSQILLASKGRRSLSFDHPRKGGKVEPNHKYQSAELRKAYALLDVIDNTKKDKVDIIAHSEGAIYSTIAASLKPEKFRNIILVAPAGMIGEDTMASLLKRFSKKGVRFIKQGIKEQDKTKLIARTNFNAVKYIAKNPLRSVQEGAAISKSNISEILPKLRSSGIGIVIISHAEDEAFPMSKIQKNVRREMADGILTVTGLHDDVYIHPEKYTAAAEEMLTALEKKAKP